MRLMESSLKGTSSPDEYLTAPEQKLSNYFFQSQGNLSFSNTTEIAGLATPSFSNGAAYADLDNDGDVDLVAVQHNGPLVVFENLSNQPAATITLRTAGGGLSPHGTYIHTGRQHHFHWPGQGYQSSHDPRVFVTPIRADRARVRWPDGTTETFPLPKPGQSAVWQAGNGS